MSNFRPSTSISRDYFEKDKSVFSRPPLLDSLSVHPSPHVNNKNNLNAAQDRAASPASSASSDPATNFAKNNLNSAQTAQSAQQQHHLSLQQSAQPHSHLLNNNLHAYQSPTETNQLFHQKNNFFQANSLTPTTETKWTNQDPHASASASRIDTNRLNAQSYFPSGPSSMPSEADCLDAGGGLALSMARSSNVSLASPVSYDALDERPLPPPRNRKSLGSTVDGADAFDASDDDESFGAAKTDASRHRKGAASSKLNPTQCFRETKAAQKKSAELHAQVQRLEKRVRVLSTENESLKQRAEGAAPAEEKIKRLKRKNAELAAIARRLEEKIKGMEMRDQNRSLPVGRKGNTSDSSIGVKAKLRPSSSSTSALNGSSSGLNGRRDSIGCAGSPTPELESGEDGVGQDHFKKIYARQRAKDLAEHAKIVMGKEKEIEGLKETVRSLADNVAIGESQILFNSAREGNCAIFGEAAELHRVIAQAAKERLILEAQLMRGFASASGRERRGLEAEEPSLPSWATNPNQRTVVAEPTVEFKIEDRGSKTPEEERSSDLRELKVQVEQLSRVARENEILKRELSEIHGKCKELEVEAEEKERELKEALALSRETEDKEREVAELRQELNDLRKKLNFVEKNLTEANRLTEDLTKSSESVKRRCAELEKTETDCRTLREKLNESETIRSRSDEKVSAMEMRLSHLQTMMIAMQAVSAQFENLKLSHSQAVQELQEKDRALHDSKMELEKIVTKNREAANSLEEKLKRMNEKFERQSSRHNAVVGQLQLKQEEADKWKLLYSDSIRDITKLHSKEKELLKQQENRRKTLLQVAIGATASANAASDAAESCVSSRANSASDSECSTKVKRATTPPTSAPASPKRAATMRSVGEPSATSSPMKTTASIENQRPKSLSSQTKPSNLNFVLYKAVVNYDPPPACLDEDFRLSKGEYVFVYGDGGDGRFEAEKLDGSRGSVPRGRVARVQEGDYIEMSTVKKLFSQLSRNNLHDVSLSVGNATLGGELDRSGESNPSLDSSRKILCFADTTLANLSGDIVPAPSNLVFENQADGTLIISWKSPSPEMPILRYLVYLNDAIYIEIAANNLSIYRTILDGVNFDARNRVTVKSVTESGCSPSAACTALLGQSSEPRPSEVVASFVTCDSATVTWLPGDSNLSHEICVDDEIVGTLQPGVYSSILSGLSPNTSYEVKVVPRIEDKPSNIFAVVSISTKPPGPLEPPLDVRLCPGGSKGSVKVSWLPLSLTADGRHNFLQISAYSIHADGREILRSQDSLVDSMEVNIDSVILPCRLTVRTISGAKTSHDSNPVQLSEEILKSLESNFGAKSSLPPSDVSTSSPSEKSTDDSGIKSLIDSVKPTIQFVAKWDYNPSEASPNVDSEIELSFKRGEVVTVYGDVDEDGFYVGELRGAKGLVPSNFLTPLLRPSSVASGLETIQESNEESRERRDSFDSDDRDRLVSSPDYVSDKRSSVGSRRGGSDEASSSPPLSSSPRRLRPRPSLPGAQIWSGLRGNPQLSSTKMSSAPSSPTKTAKRFAYSVPKPAERRDRKSDESVMTPLDDLSRIASAAPDAAVSTAKPEIGADCVTAQEASRLQVPPVTDASVVSPCSSVYSSPPTPNFDSPGTNDLIDLDFTNANTYPHTWLI